MGGEPPVGDANPNGKQGRVTVLITGASSGIGEAVAKRLAETGEGRLILHGRSVERLEAVAAEVRSSGAWEVECIFGDVREWLADGQPEADLPPLDGVVWSAGICELAPASYLKEAAFQEILEINLVVPVLVLGRWFRKRILARGARVVVIGSQAAHQAGPGFAAYAASKGGLSAAARVLAAEFERRAVSVHCLEP